MEIALARARRAARAGEVPVGALIVDASGKILAVGENRMEKNANPCAHAEMLAIQDACAASSSMRLTDCVLVCTLEPCLMCAAAAAHACIAGIVYGATDPLAGAVVSCADFGQLPLAGRRIWHMGGILGDSCAALLNDFFYHLRNRKG